MSTTNVIGCRLTFLLEKQTKAYIWYVDGSITKKNENLRQDLLQSSVLCPEAGRRGA